MKSAPDISDNTGVTILGINLEQTYATDLMLVHDVENAMTEEAMPILADLAEAQSMNAESYIQRFLVGLLVEAAQKLFEGRQDAEIQYELKKGENGPSTLRKMVVERLSGEFSRFPVDKLTDRLKRAYAEFLRRPHDIARRAQKTKGVERVIGRSVSETLES